MESPFKNSKGKKGFSEKFVTLRDLPGFAPARTMIRRVTSEFADLDGNFIQQFQTTGFDARVFELCIFKYFHSSGWLRNENHNSPDFIFEKNGKTICIEATTANKSSKLDKDREAKHFVYMNEKELAEDLERTLPEIPIRFGSPLLKKLEMKYWEKEHCKDLPLILAIEGFWSGTSLTFPDTLLGEYLFGIRATARHNEMQEIVLNYEGITKHQLGEKVIPSNFFGLPNCENISAVLFSNSSTVAKFNRMAFQEGLRTDNLEMIRFGTCYTHDHNALLPTEFNYRVNERWPKETWGEGMSLFVNPNAKVPIDIRLFDDIVINEVKNGAIISKIPAFHPFTSITQTNQIQHPKRR